ncbi:unnamed protein product [Calypogeia fissa]
MRSGGGYTWRTQGRYRYARWRGNLPRQCWSLSTIPFESTGVTPHEWTNQQRGRGGQGHFGPPHPSPLAFRNCLRTSGRSGVSALYSQDWRELSR